ncbi:MAG: alcohol dehydrogenase catalytic domain-containing protein [Blastocatellia bacterium]|nr:alcohol dehydrogenase catalytic domain-containing protein [Blastocatellia bacterium]
MRTMRVVQVARPGGPFELVQREIPEPGPRQVRVKVQACGLCHSESLTKEGHWPGIEYPRVPGHEIAGVIDAVGSEVPRWKPGQRVGIGWLGSYCGYCESCRRGSFVTCANQLISGITMDGGYQEYVLVPFEGLALIPDELSPVEAGPLMCAGITTFNSLRNSGARAGDTVAVLGIGGLGHLGVQFAAKMGFRTIAIARGKDKEPLARELGAHYYIDSQAGDVSEALQKLGGARIILATVTSAEAMGATIGGLAIDGRLIVIGADFKPMPLVTAGLVSRRTGIYGWPSGSSVDSEDTMRFSAMTGVRPMIETFPLEKAAEAYDRMMSGKARFRVVITI